MTISKTQIPGEAASRERFQRLAAEWKQRSRHMSNTAQMAMLPPYQKIIGMGIDAVPLILEELQREPDQWFWALEAITEENPVPLEAAGRVQEMADAWIEWGRLHGFLMISFDCLKGVSQTRVACPATVGITQDAAAAREWMPGNDWVPEPAPGHPGGDG